ncbi:MAG: hypothetical protein DMF12_00035 [Verrucomicrobia bacterium]|nr:MAG: hypothetical protein DMF12_00035 [Verrucomicrobiota bacterium]
MARISGLEKEQAPWHLRWFYGAMRKMFGKDFTPAKIQMRLPSLVWGGRGAHWLRLLNRRQFCRGQKSRPER